MIDTHIAGTGLGSRRLAAVTPSEVQARASDRARVLAPTTLRNLVSLLRSVYASAVLDRLVAASPVVRLSLPPRRRRITSAQSKPRPCQSPTLGIPHVDRQKGCPAGSPYTKQWSALG